MSIGANWADIWAPVWGQVWTQVAAAPPSQSVTLAPGPARQRWYTKVGDQTVTGTREQIEALLRQVAQEHAQEDEEAIEAGKQPKPRAVRVVSPGRASAKPAPAALETRVHIPQALQSDIAAEEAQRIYMLAYAAYMQREAIRQDDEDVSELVLHVTSRRAEAAKAVAQLIERLQRLIA